MPKLPFQKSWWIDPGRVLGGCFPGTPDPARSHEMLTELATAGVRVIVNLQEETECGRGETPFPDYRPMLAEAAAAQGVEVEFHRFPVRDHDVPEQEVMVRIEDLLRHAVQAGNLVYVHCWGGHGRTGTVAGCWLVDHGYTPDEAIGSMKANRAHDAHLCQQDAPQTDVQRAFIKAWAARESRRPGHVSAASSAPVATAGDQARDRAIGSLVGLAVGDAVGITLEFKPPGTFKPLTDMIGGGPFGLKAGEWTDDTSMTLCLAESLVEREFFDPVDQLARYVRWWKEGHHSVTGRCFDIGNQVCAALSDHIESGKPFCGPTGASNAGNGSLMRLCPVVMAHTASPAAAIVYAGESSRTTHGNRECVDACRYFAGLLAGAMRGESKQLLLDPMYSPISGLWDAEPLQPKIAAIAGGSFKLKQPPAIRGSGYVVDCLEAALWAFHQTDSFEEAVLAATNLGDDADTTAAVCGQIAGAHYGLSRIPDNWLGRLALRDRIEKLAGSLWELGRSRS